MGPPWSARNVGLRMRTSLRRRVGMRLAVAIWLAIGLWGAYAYLDGYAVHRGFAAVTTPAGVARGSVRTVRFYSPAVGRRERYLVYLPPHYAAEAAAGRRFPVMYLLHGAPGTMASFTNIDAIDARTDLLLARHRIRPMILVMPAGEQGLRADDEWANTPAQGRWMDFVMDVVRNVDHRFATRASEGAYGALNIGLRHLGAFSVIESWSGYFAENRTGPFTHASAALLAANSPADYLPSLTPIIRRRGLRVWLLQGQTDWRSPALIERFAAQLHAEGADVRYGFFPGGHDWGLWRAQTPRMLEAADRWFAERPGQQVGLGHVGHALSRAVRIRLRQRQCLALKPRRARHTRPACRAYRAAHGLVP
jgi:putative tributyrin esterase